MLWAGPCRSHGACSGYYYPWLVKSEAMHYGYALIMLSALWLLRSGFTGTQDRRWWMVAFWIQFWHHIEHALLQGQYLLGHNLFGQPVPTSILQLWAPRVELHLFYNTIVFIPMMIAMYSPHVPSQGQCRKAEVHVRLAQWTRARGLTSGIAVAALVGCGALARAARAVAIRGEVEMSWTLEPSSPTAGRQTRALVRLRDASGRPVRGARLQVEATWRIPAWRLSSHPRPSATPGVYEATSSSRCLATGRWWRRARCRMADD